MTAVGADKRKWLERMARFGYLAKALLYVTIGALAAAAAFGLGGGATDTRGAMSAAADAPFGRVLVIALALGLIGYAIWRVTEGIADPEERGTDARALALRTSFILRGLGHAALAVTAFAIAFGKREQSSGGGAEPEEMTRTAFSLPGGEWLVYATAAGIAGYGGYQLYRAFAAKLGKKLDMAELREETGRWILVVSRVGIAARGIVFMAVAWLLVRAARERDPGEAGGLAEALRALGDLGQLPFAAIALGLVAYGVYQGLNARYREVGG